MYFLWWSFLAVVLVIAWQLGLSGTPRLILEIAAAVVFLLLVLAYRIGEQLHRQENGQQAENDGTL